MSTPAFFKTAYFAESCPNCGGIIDDRRLSLGQPCEKCLETPRVCVCKALRNKQCLKEMATACRVWEETDRFKSFFTQKVGSSPWALQLTWAKRAFLKKSFAIVAPTGVGKTTFGLVFTAYLSQPSYILLPTKLLVKQAYERLLKFLPPSQIAVYLGKKDEKERIATANYKVLITTVNFFYRNFELIPKHFFKFIFVDDVDAVLKSSKNVDYLFKLMGFSDEDIKLALKRQKTEAERERLKKLSEHKDIILIVSSATVQPKTNRVMLFQQLLGFEVQQAQSNLRNIVDLWQQVENEDEALQEAAAFIQRYGGGCFLFVSADNGKEGVERTVSFLNKQGIKATAYHKVNDAQIKAFCQGELKVVVGISNAYNPLVRGVDLPEAVRYVIFLDVPKLIFPTVVSLRPSSLFGLLTALKDLLPAEKLNSYLSYVRRYLSLSETQIDRYPRIKTRLEEIAAFLEAHLNDKDFIERIKKDENIGLKEKNGQLYIVVGDTNGYLQASGRASRLFAGGLSKGLALTLYWDKKAARSLFKRMRFQDSVRFAQMEEVDFNALFKEIDADRERIKAIKAGKDLPEKKDLFKTTLVVVESPTKAKTIASLFGRPSRRRIGHLLVYEINLEDRLLCITASLGHVYDLTISDGYFGVKKEDGRFLPVYAPIKSCLDCGVQTTENLCPRCHKPLSLSKAEVIQALKQIALEVDEILIATDPDTEGEKIGWDISLLLRPFHPVIKRAEFHEVTRRAFLKAIKNLRSLHLPLVKAQILRRIADRWVGFILSQRLWEAFQRRTLSAGRVQTPVLGWVIEREKERRQKKARISFSLGGFSLSFEELDLDKAKEIFTRLEQAKIIISDAGEKTISSPPPYHTGPLLTDASQLLYLSVSQTMHLLQELFEKGIITYHRTDSMHVSEVGREVAKEYITAKFGEEVLQKRTWAKEGTHECIRPTRPLDEQEIRYMLATGTLELSNPKQALRLYRLIFNRFMASQMKDAQVKVKELKLCLPEIGWEKEWEIYTEVIEPGFSLLKPLKITPLKEIIIKDKELRLVPKAMPYTEGSLVEEMKQRGLGRPSTYAKIVSVLLERRYLISHKNYLFPTRLGKEVFTFLDKHYHEYVNEEFTRQLEEKMDAVEENKLDYQQVLTALFKEVVEKEWQEDLKEVEVSYGSYLS